MDQFDCIDLPRKKLKMDHTLTNDHNLHSTSSASNIKMQESPAGTHTGGDRLEKEAACGITEYVSPDSLGFSGILKKRYDCSFEHLPLTLDLKHSDTPTSSSMRSYLPAMWFT